MLTGAAAAGITAAAALIGGGASASSANNLNNKSIAFARENREYNTPANIRKRLEAAGYNPMALADVNNQTTSAGAVPQLQPENQFGEAIANAVPQGVNSLAELMNARSGAITADATASNAATNAKNFEVAKEISETTKQVNTATAALIAKQTELEDERITTEVFQRNVMQVQADLLNSHIKVNNQQAAYIQKQVENYAGEFALQWFRARTERQNANTSRMYFNEFVREFESDPNNTWYNHLSDAEKGSVREMLKTQFYNAMARDASQFVIQNEESNWINTGYYRFMRYGLGSATGAIGPVLGVSFPVGTQSQFLGNSKPVMNRIPVKP